jgi:hypothetical protein
MASYGHCAYVSDLACDVLNMKAWPTTPILGWNDSLAFVGIESFLFILIVNLLVGIWGYYDGCVFVGSGSLFFILLLCRIMDIAYCMAITLISSNVC